VHGHEREPVGARHAVARKVDAERRLGQLGRDFFRREVDLPGRVRVSVEAQVFSLGVGELVEAVLAVFCVGVGVRVRGKVGRDGTRERKGERERGKR